MQFSGQTRLYFAARQGPRASVGARGGSVPASVQVGVDGRTDCRGSVWAGGKIEVDHAKVIHEGTDFQGFSLAMELDAEAPDPGLVGPQGADILLDSARLSLPEPGTE